MGKRNMGTSEKQLRHLEAQLQTKLREAQFLSNQISAIRILDSGKSFPTTKQYLKFDSFGPGMPGVIQEQSEHDSLDPMEEEFEEMKGPV